MTPFAQHLMPWIRVLVAQAAALAAGLMAVRHAEIPLPLLLAAQGLLAAVLGRLMRLSAWWMPIQLALPLAVAYNAAMPSWLYPAALVLCALVFWNSASEQVPLYLTNRRTRKALSKLVTAERAGRFVDLGSGMGGVVGHLAAAHPSLQARGVETAPLVFAASRIRMLLGGVGNAQMIYRSIWDEDLSQYDIVYCFLSPVPMPRLFEKAKAEMRPGTLMVSNSFAVPGEAATAIIHVEDGRRTRLHLYRM